MPSSRSAGERAALIGLGLILAAGAAGAAPRPLPPGPAGKEPPPNLLIITVDTLRADRLSCYDGRSVKTETMDRLAARGVVFRRAFAQATTTLPSHTNMFLGLTPLRHGVHDNGNFVVGKGFLTLAEHLKAAGYATAAFIGGFPLDSRFGLDRGFDLYDEALEDRGTSEQSYRERPAADVVAGAVRWLDGRTGAWFAWVHCYDPHHPYQPPEPFLSAFKGRPYDGEVAYVDQALKKLLDAVDGPGGGRTVIILTGDHGESLGQHGEDTHGFLAYNTTLWVPLIIAAPGLKPGRVDQLAVHTDLFPTVCDLLGLRAPSGLDGLSLMPAIRGGKMPPRAAYFESMFPYFSRGWAPIDGYLQGTEKFIDSPIPELFDLGADFDESKNLLAGGDPARYRARLAQVTGGRSPMERIAEEKPLDREAVERLRSLGYLASPRPVRKPDYGPRDDVKVLLPLHNKCSQAQTLFESGRGAEAIELLKSVLTEREDFDGGYATLGVIYARLGRVADALTVLRRGLELNPDNYLIASPLVHLLNKVGRFDETIGVIAAEGRYPFEHEFDSWTALGVAYLNTGDLEKARQAFGSALDLDVDDYLTHRNLGDVELADYGRTKDPAAYDKAVAYYLRAIELNPRDPSSRNALGFTYLQGGRPKEAIPPLLKALELFPDYDTAVYNLGQAYFSTGDYEKALAQLVRFRDKFAAPLTPTQRGAVDALIRECRSRLGGR